MKRRKRRETDGQTDKEAKTAKETKRGIISGCNQTKRLTMRGIISGCNKIKTLTKRKPDKLTDR